MTIADTWAQVEAAAYAVQSRASQHPRIAIVLGSGLGTLAEALPDAISVPYADIPYMPRSTAPGHAGRLLVGKLEDQSVLLFDGRAHLYEGYSADDVTFAVRLARRLGAEALIITNAAGGLNPDFTSGTLMLICDHINLTCRNPLLGPSDARMGTRFPDMTEAYDPVLRVLARMVAEQQEITLVEGVYLGLLGPNYETPAEVRMARILGGDAVGMSTVLEVIAANHVGLRVLGISCITNAAAGMLPGKLTEEEVIDTAHAVRDQFASLVRGVIAAYPGDGGDHT